ncbi:TPA: hypothetical protein HA251_07115 [Candidatus Woesearchaeota archaeon]|nr:hypothetical protein [Candidatus Woesearchaeota archaeon]
MDDELSKAILHTLSAADEPLETKEIEANLKKSGNHTRTKVFYRLNMLRGDGKIKGKFSGPGKGVWIWWRIDAFRRGAK